MEKLEKDVNRSAGKSRKKEVSESARFVVDGIHEAENYLAIVKKVIEKTDRILRNKALTSANKPSGSIEQPAAIQTNSVDPEPKRALHRRHRRVTGLQSTDQKSTSPDSSETSAHS